MVDAPHRPLNINTLWGRIAIDELLRCGVRTVCVSPGSRSTPLVAAAASNPGVEAIPIVDERSAAFFASGIARRRDEPIALICTSGTAGAHYFPALCEARRSRLPLIVLTADRPPRLQACGASQAMDQRDLFAPHRVWFQQAAEPEGRADKLRALRSLIDRAVARASGTLGASSGPVHLNFPFRKPLEPLGEEPHPTDAISDGLWHDHQDVIQGRTDADPQVGFVTGPTDPPEGIITALTHRLEESRRPLIIAGADHRSKRYATAMAQAARDWHIPILAESTSAIRYARTEQAPLIHSVDLLMESDAYDSAPPDLVIRVGRTSVQWSGRKTLARWKDITQLLVTRYDTYEDPNHLVGHHLIAHEERFFDALATQAPDSPTPHHSAWLNAHLDFDDVARSHLSDHLSRSRADDAHVLSAAHIWDRLTGCLTPKSALFVSSSMPIRDVDTFSAHRDLDIDLYFQRGLNGIDGTLSTGLAIAYDRRHHNAPTVLAIGDVAYRHDQGALALALELELDTTVVVLDNGGGAIFDYLPIADSGDLHEDFFATSGHRPLAIADSPQLSTLRVDDDPSFSDALQRSIDAPGTQVILAQTERDDDMRWRQRLRAGACQFAFEKTAAQWKSHR